MTESQLPNDRPDLGGRLVLRDEDGYEQARVARIFHARRPDRHPVAVLSAESEADVVEGVRLAGRNGWTVAVRSGGHSFPVWSLRDDALMIDLGGLKEMSYDPDTGIVSVGPAVTGGDELNPYLRQFGRFFQGGGCSSVGVGGFLLQGGIGWNFRGWGWAAEQVVAIDVVTAEGKLVRADATENQDLFWAARGAGPGFCGVVTRFHIQTRPLPKALSSLLQLYPIAMYPQILAWLRDAQGEIADTVHLNGITVVPPFPVPGHVDGELAFGIWAVAFCESADEADRALAPLVGNPFVAGALMNTGVTPTTLPDEHRFVDSGHPADLHYRVDSAWMSGPTEEIVAATRKLVLERPADDIGYTFFQFALPESGADIAASMSTDVMIGTYLITEDDSRDADNRAWLLAAMADLEPFTVGQYWGDSDQATREVKCLSDQSWERLQDVRAARDPEGRFATHLAGPGGFRNVNGWQTPAS